MKPISLLIFDLDGTLVNTLEDIAASVNHTLGRLGKSPLPLETVRCYVGDGLANLLLRTLDGQAELVPEAVKIYTEHHRTHLVDRSCLYPSVRETLEHFKALPLAVVTNKTREFSILLLERLGIGQYFKQIIGAGSGLPLKPAPDALFAIMKETGATNDRTVMVGDSSADVRAGRAAGVITCAVTYGFRSAEELRGSGPDHLIPAFSYLTNLFAPEK